MYTRPSIALLALLFLCGVAKLSASDYKEFLPRIAPTEADATLPQFRIADGYEIQLIAAEPLVNSPVAIEWDASGALFVCEMRGYSEDRDDRISRITRLTDTNGDGVFDRHTVYADQLFWPTALFPYDGGLFVADAPDILYLKDEDGDGVADSKRVVFTGFSIGNVQGLLNCFRWGLDNRIHLACGTVGGRVRRAADSEADAIEVRGHDIAFDPKTEQFELTSGGAQHGMCFDDWGRKFVSSNSDHLQQVMYEDRYLKRNPSLAAPPARQSIAADGPQAEVFRISPVEPWRVVRTRLRVAGLARGPIEGGGRAAGYFTGATGVTIYRGDAWPEADRSLAIVGDVGSNLVHRKRLTSDNDVQLVGRRIDPESEFIASKDNWFRPAQFACGPDGTLAIVDVYREVIEHPKSLPPEIKQHLDLTSGRDRGRIYRVYPKGYQHRRSEDFGKLSDSELVQRLAHTNAWHRETAARLIYQRQPRSATDQLRRQCDQCPTATGRLHSLYALDGLGQLTASDVALRLNDPHPQVVRHAVRLSEQFADEQLIRDAMEKLVEHESIDVRYQTAFSLGEFGVKNRPELLAKLLRKDPDNRWIETAVLSSSYGEGDRLLEHLLSKSPLSKSWDGRLAQVVTKLAVQIDRRNDAGSRRRAIHAIVDADDSTSFLPAINVLAGQSQRGRLDPQLAMRVEQKAARLVKLSIGIVADESQADSVRAAEIRRLSGNTDAAFVSSLRQIIDQSTSSELLTASISAIGRLDFDSIGALLIDKWPQWSPRVRAAAGEILFASETRTLKVLDAIKSGAIDTEDISLVRWQSLAESRRAEVRKFAEDYLKQTASSRQSVLEDYRSVLEVEGDPIKGAEVFKQQCAACHRAGETGNEIGPNLAAVATRGADAILTNVLDPNREVNPQYVNYVVLSSDGQTIAGMITSENANSITITAAESKRTTILRQDIELIRNTNQSIMPEGFERTIPKQSMADLIAYLVNELGLPSSSNTPSGN